MSELYHDFTERLKALRTENGGFLAITSVREADSPEITNEIHAACHDDPVLRPEDDEELAPGAEVL